ncbi:MAG TPA: hypothetical protein VNU97_13785 [Rhizomicrobium sp.]|nr:hypothetical protein [Rhizomicrobium sp.]
MKRTIAGFSAALLALNGLSGAAWAADCASQADSAALRTAALQQALMVAAFSCHDVARYNRFVLDHQPELIDADARLKAFFVRRDARHSDAGYHTYKTELANAASLRSIRDDAFCGGADDAFDVAAGPLSLAAAVDAQPWVLAASFPTCPGTAPLLQTAAAAPPPRAERSNDDAADDRDGDDRAPPRWRHDRAPRPAAFAERPSDQAAAGISVPQPHRKIEADGTL